MYIEDQLREEISTELEKLGGMELGSEQYKTTVDGLTKLMDRAIEAEKFEIERQDKLKEQEVENSLKLKQMQDENKDRLIRNILAGFGILIPAGLTIWGTVKSFEFEKNGTITTIIGRGFVNKLLPKK